MLIKRFIFVFCLLLFCSTIGYGCACCSEPGTYDLSTRRLDTYQLSILNEIDFAQTASLYMTEAGFDSIKGLQGIQAEYESGSWTASPGEFNLVDSFLNKTWKLTLKTPGVKSGTLTLPMPSLLTSFSVDIHDGTDQGNDPSLYKEFRFSGVVGGGTGIFRSGLTRPAKYLLVFQGRGNNCDNSSDFTHWHLDVSGRNADYSFFGTLKGSPAQP